MRRNRFHGARLDYQWLVVGQGAGICLGVIIDKCISQKSGREVPLILTLLFRLYRRKPVVNEKMVTLRKIRHPPTGGDGRRRVCLNKGTQQQENFRATSSSLLSR